ncbi:MAG: TcpQ domain-containing protein, partial [Alphaproteobacteria bacterium]|nr:TcpQ domain-containing protein [Alphaproteobacteria bacterium]
VMLGARDGLDRIESCFAPKGKRQNQQATRQDQEPDGPKPGMRTSIGGQELGVAPAQPVTPQAGSAAASQESVAAAYRKLVDQEQQNYQGQTMPPSAAPQGKANPGPQSSNRKAASDVANIEPAAGTNSRLAKMFERAEQGLQETRPAPLPAPAALPQGSAPPMQQAAPAPQRAVAAPTDAQALAQNWLAQRAPTPPRQVQVPAPQMVAQPVKATAQSVDMAREWNAQAGVGLREVLDSWANKAHARLLWQADTDYALPATLTAQGTFESAVLSALKQFEGADTPPLGQIYLDPVTGQKVLLITAD